MPTHLRMPASSPVTPEFRCGRRVFTLGSLVLAELGVTRLCEAAIARGLSLRELVAASDRVLVGRAAGAESRFETFRSGRRIVTYTRVIVERTWIDAGKGATEISVRVHGGRVGQEAELVFGQPEFTLGEASLLFLKTLNSGFDVVTGMAQGQYRLVPRVPNGTLLLPARSAPRLLRMRDSAVSRLAGTDLATARELVLSVRR
ncbi:MAG TPA: hypothetical protein VIM73_17530 [Polyangiaceae bacterium]